MTPLFHILYYPVVRPFGGANQFLNALKAQLNKMNAYTENIDRADVLLFNSYPFRHENLFTKLLFAKKRDPKKIVLYRIDGPISSYRNSDIIIDRSIALFAKLICDGIVFQSQWSKDENISKFDLDGFETRIIHNAADPSIFNTQGRVPLSANRKIRLIGSAWSVGKNKGTDLWHWLDHHLDFSRYEAAFIGNSIGKFDNIAIIAPLSTKILAELFKKSDIYIFSSKIEACSNALIEALSCGLPALAPNSSSNPEIVQRGGLLYSTGPDLLKKLDEVTAGLNQYTAKLPIFSIEKAASQYLEFAQHLISFRDRNLYQPKTISFSNFQTVTKLLANVVFYRVSKYLNQLFH